MHKTPWQRAAERLPGTHKAQVGLLLLEFSYEALVEAIVPQAALRRFSEPFISVLRYVVVEPIAQEGRHYDTRHCRRNARGRVQDGSSPKTLRTECTYRT